MLRRLNNAEKIPKNRQPMCVNRTPYDFNIDDTVVTAPDPNQRHPTSRKSAGFTIVSETPKLTSRDCTRTPGSYNTEIHGPDRIQVIAASCAEYRRLTSTGTIKFLTPKHKQPASASYLNLRVENKIDEDNKKIVRVRGTMAEIIMSTST